MKRSEQEYPNDFRAQKIFEHGFKEGMKANSELLMRLIRAAEFAKLEFEDETGEKIS